MFKDTRAHSGFPVNEVQKAKALCGQTLGLEVSETDGDLELQIAGGTKILIYSRSDHTPATFTILNFPVGDIERAVDELTKARVRFLVYNEGDIYNGGDLTTDEEGIFPGSPKIAWFKDPAGNILSVLEEG